MAKINFIIDDIRVSKSPKDGYCLEVFLNDGTQVIAEFCGHNLFHSAQQLNGNVPNLKSLFSKEIQNILDTNPQYFYYLTDCDLFDINFESILEDPVDDIFGEAMDLIRSCAIEKDIEFDGYFAQRWKDSADTIVSFDEEYFDDPDRRDLYVYLSALVDKDIFGFLNQVYYFHEHCNITKEIIEDKIQHLTKVKGVKF